VICGYRTPWSNEFLRTRNPHTGVAQYSLHMQAEAWERIILFSEFSPSMPTSLLALLVTLGSILRSRLDLCLRKN
jgi:hypothetical protein